MRWAALITIGIAAALGSLMMGPMWVAREVSYASRLPAIYELWFLLIYLVPLFAVAGTVALLFLRLDLARRHHEVATRMALGETRETQVRGAARDGWRRGLFAGAAGVVVAMVVAQLIFDEAALPGDGELSTSSLVARLMVLLIAMGTCVLVHVIAMAAVTRGTPDAADAAGALDADAPRERAGWVRWARMAWWGAYLVSLGFVTVNRFVPLDEWALENLADPGWLMVTKNIAMTISLVGTLWLVAVVARWLAVSGVRGSAALLASGATGTTGARAIAADGLARRSANRTRVLTVAAIISGLVALSLAGLGHSQAADAAARDASPQGYVFAVDIFSEEVQPAGFAEQALDPVALAALDDDPRVDVVPLSLLFDQPYDYTAEGADWHREGTAQDVMIAVDVEAANAVAPDALRTLGLMDGVILTSMQWESEPVGFPSDEEFWVEYEHPDSADETPVYRIATALQMNQTDRTWASEVWGPAPISGAMLFVADGQPAQTDVFAVAGEYIPPQDVTLWAASSDRNTWFGGVGVAMSVIGLGIGVVMIVSATATSVRLRRRELATFAALGARPADLRAAPVWEAGVLATASAVAGTVMGVLVSVASTNLFLLEPGAPFDPAEIAWHLGADLAAVPWGWLLVALAATVLAAVAAAAAFGRAMTGQTPVEELRTADKEGVR